MHGGPPREPSIKMGVWSEIHYPGRSRRRFPASRTASSHLAKLAHKTATVRSFVTGDGNHDISRSSARTRTAPIRDRSSPRGRRTMRRVPTNIALFPVGESQAQGEQELRRLPEPRFGSAHAPFRAGRRRSEGHDAVDPEGPAGRPQAAPSSDSTISARLRRPGGTGGPTRSGSRPSASCWRGSPRPSIFPPNPPR
jgi:hypothetical protein